MIAVDAASGAVLGALDAQFLERTEGGRASRLSRAFEDRQSVRWLAATRRAGELRGAARVTVVADREADMFELFAHRPAHVDLVVRAMPTARSRGAASWPQRSPGGRASAMPR